MTTTHASRSPAIDITALRVNRGGHTVLDSITLAVTPGIVTGLLGPSGCGKTTLLRTIVGTQPIAAGSVRVFGLRAGSRALRKRVGYVTQSPSIYPDITTIENVRYFAALYGVERAAADEAIAAVGLTGQARQLAGTLSGGQRGRVSLACALVASPDLLILDEPTVGLDPVLRIEMWSHFSELAERGTTILVSSHVMDEAARCDDLILLREGAVLAHSTPDQLRADTHTTDLEEAFLSLIQRTTQPHLLAEL
ncbi:ABC transporter ATP-binding protein [Nocardia nepalensis]|uniref:ABC transporter ATP-binding protein n=1 Tax=Nocardia nepalensis TaxID=3375448 RepID=UPI003B680ADA